MLLHISSDGPPIYQQIVEQIRFRIISGQLRGGNELPTIRGLAETLRVNPNTVARAYRELEHESADREASGRRGPSLRSCQKSWASLNVEN